MEDRQHEDGQAGRLVCIEIEGVPFRVDPQSLALDDACPMCEWERGSNPTSCFECAIVSEDDVKYRAGHALGEAILASFEAIAVLDGMTLQETIDEWVSVYVAERIANEAADE